MQIIDIHSSVAAGGRDVGWTGGGRGGAIPPRIDHCQQIVDVHRAAVVNVAGAGDQVGNNRQRGDRCRSARLEKSQRNHAAAGLGGDICVETEVVQRPPAQRVGVGILRKGLARPFESS